MVSDGQIGCLFLVKNQISWSATKQEEPSDNGPWVWHEEAKWSPQVLKPGTADSSYVITYSPFEQVPKMRSIQQLFDVAIDSSPFSVYLSIGADYLVLIYLLFTNCGG